MTCSCKNIKFNDVMYASRTDVKINLSQTGVQYPYCKNCGDWLTTTQKEKHDLEKVEKWEERKRIELNMIKKTLNWGCFYYLPIYSNVQLILL